MSRAFCTLGHPFSRNRATQKARPSNVNTPRTQCLKPLKPKRSGLHSRDTKCPKPSNPSISVTHPPEATKRKKTTSTGALNKPPCPILDLHGLTNQPVQPPSPLPKIQSLREPPLLALSRQKRQSPLTNGTRSIRQCPLGRELSVSGLLAAPYRTLELHVSKPLLGSCSPPEKSPPPRSLLERHAPFSWTTPSCVEATTSNARDWRFVTDPEPFELPHDRQIHRYK